MTDATEPSSERAFLDRYFGLSESGSDVRTEFIAGITTFLTMVYIVFVNPQILGNTGMDKGAVFVATCIAAAVSTLVMALYANYPIALAPGMGLNAFFAFTVVLTMKYTWQQALAAVFCSGVIFFFISIFRIREYIINAIPRNLKLAISAGVGLFLGIIALEEAKIVVASPATLVMLGDLRNPAAVLCLFGLVLIAALNYRRVAAATLIGVLAVTAIGIPLGLAAFNAVVPDRGLQLFVRRCVRQCRHVDRGYAPGRPGGCAGQSAADETGACRRQFRRDVRLADRYLDHDQLYRKRRRRCRRRAHRADRVFCRAIFPGGTVFCPARRHDPGLRFLGGAALRRLRDGARLGGDGLGRHYRNRAGGRCGRDHAAHLFDRDRHRAWLHHLCAHQAHSGPLRRCQTRGVGAGADLRDQVRTGLAAACQRLLERQKISPGKPLLQRAAQQKGRMKSCQCADFATPGVVGKPAPARARNAVFDAKQRLHGRAAKTNEKVRIGEFDLAADERQADGGFLRGWGAVAGRPPRHDVGDVRGRAIDIDRRHHAVEQFSGAPDEGPADN